MVKVNENDVKSKENREIIENNKNINKNNYNDNINTYSEHKVKLFKYCQKCGKDFERPSEDMFCSWECKKDYYAEEHKEMDSCYREWSGRD